MIGRLIILCLVVPVLIAGMSCEPGGPQGSPTAIHLGITATTLGGAVPAGGYRMITFHIQWENSWRTSSSPDNWDAAWVFVKYRAGGGAWRHATLSTVPAEHQCPSGTAIDPPSDGKGVFIRNGAPGGGALDADVSLRWNYGLDGVADDADVSVSVFGLEMVYIPEGGFFVGDNDASDAALIKGSDDNRPWHIASESAIEVTNAVSDGFYYRSSKDIWNDIWNASEDVSGSSFIIPADFPKGYRAIYCMKYEMTQKQYVDFLNTLAPAQSSNRYDRANANRFGYTIYETDGVYSTDHPDRACGFLSPADSYAYADWAGLRPMTELEFEKICRGSGNPSVNLEFAWGTTYRKNAVDVTGTESDREYLTRIGANSYYMDEGFQPPFPLDAGIFADAGKSREMSGATYYGVFEMSTNLSELCISIGNAYGRVFTGRNGDGRLSEDGFADEIGWPQRDGIGGGYRGGCIGNEQGHMCVSVRVEAAVAIDYTHRHIPWGFRAVRSF